MSALSALRIACADRLRTAFQGLDVTFVNWDGASAPGENVDLIIAPLSLNASGLARLAGTHNAPERPQPLLQWHSIGYNAVEEHLPTGIRFANAAGVYEESTAELALTLILMQERNAARILDAQRRAVWEPFWVEGLASRHVVILGAGGVANAIVRRLLAFGASVDRYARSERTDALGHVHALADLSTEALYAADVLILAVPLTEDTHHLLGTTMLAQLRDGTLVVNVARGSVADTQAILAEAGRLRFALDVTDPEPLPQNHPLWSQPSVLISPHMGGHMRTVAPLMRKLCRTQAKRLLAGEEPLNLIHF